MKNHIVRKGIFSLVILAGLLMINTTAAKAQEGMMGEIKIFAGNFAPRGWMLCQGQILAISQYSALFSILGTTYGGDGRTTFALPDFRGRAPIQSGQGPGLNTYRLGDKVGRENVQVMSQNMPSHNHAAQISENSAQVVVKASSSIGTTSVAGKNGATTLASTTTARAATGTVMYNTSEPDVTLNTGSGQVQLNGTVTVGNAGGSQPISIVQPVIAVNYIICVTGIYPSRD